MTNLVPLAGEGKRFKDAGYALPKPLIPVSGKPMIVQAIKSMPESDKWVFLCRKEHIIKYHIDRILKNEIRDCEIIEVNKTTEGQLCTCMLAEDIIEKKEPLFIGACDNGMVYDKERWKHATNSEADALVLSFTRQPNLIRNPRSWGWIEAGKDCKIKHISVKVPISDNPFNDHAVVGSFWFKTGGLFIDAAKELISKNIRINNEFYVDSLPEVLIPHGLDVEMFVIDQYIGWGTPDDLKEYEYWEDVFLKGFVNNCSKNSPVYSFWKKFFKSVL